MWKAGGRLVWGTLAGGRAADNLEAAMSSPDVQLTPGNTTQWAVQLFSRCATVSEMRSKYGLRSLLLALPNGGRGRRIPWWWSNVGEDKTVTGAVRCFVHAFLLGANIQPTDTEMDEVMDLLRQFAESEMQQRVRDELLSQNHDGD